MEGQEQDFITAESKDQQQEQPQPHIVLKRKRTKRQRTQSSIPLAIVTNGCLMITNREDIALGDDAHDHDHITYDHITYTEEEEEDMANCLILLAQGQELCHNNNYNSSFKSNSRRLLDTRDYVYQCKTCNCTFSLFQAFGGHRASHKKPKPANISVDRKLYSFSLQLNHNGGGDNQKKTAITTKVISFMNMESMGGIYLRSSFRRTHEAT